MSNFHMSKEEFHSRVVEVLQAMREQTTAHNRFAEFLNRTANSDVTLSALEEIERFLDVTAEFNRTMIQNLRKAAKSRALARINGK